MWDVPPNLELESDSWPDSSWRSAFILALMIPSEFVVDGLPLEWLFPELKLVSELAELESSLELGLELELRLDSPLAEPELEPESEPGSNLASGKLCLERLKKGFTLLIHVLNRVFHNCRLTACQWTGEDKFRILKGRGRGLIRA